MLDTLAPALTLHIGLQCNVKSFVRSMGSCTALRTQFSAELWEGLDVVTALGDEYKNDRGLQRTMDRFDSDSPVGDEDRWAELTTARRAAATVTSWHPPRRGLA
jgi:hypothetical protein